jgi:predicted MarR family transcription regulator
MTKYEFVEQWFRKRPNKKFTPAELERQLRDDYDRLHGGDFRDPLREVRKAFANGLIQRTANGANKTYWYTPSAVKANMTNYEFVEQWFRKRPNKKFTNAQLEQQLRDGYERLHGGDFRDPLREVRKAFAKGLLQRTPKGANQTYWYTPAK